MRSQPGDAAAQKLPDYVSECLLSQYFEPANDDAPKGAAEGGDRSSDVDLSWQDVPRTFTKANSSMTNGWKFEASWRQLINADFQHHKISRPEDAVWGDPGDMEKNAPDKLRKRAKNKYAIILAELESYEPGSKLYPPKDPKKKTNNRHKVNMLPACGFAVDCDGAPPYEENVRGIDAEGVACIGASSFNHSPPMVHKYRFFIPVREPIPVELHTAVFEKIAKRLKIEGVDPACMRAQQCSFLPTHDGVSETFIDLSRFDRPLLSVEKEIEEARAEAEAEAKKSPRERVRDARRKETAKRAEWFRLIETGENLHDPLLRLSSSFVNDGLSEEEIVDRLRKAMEASDARISRPGDWQNRYDSIPRLVREAYDKWGDDEHVIERREVLAWGEDRKALRDHIDNQIAGLTKASIETHGLADLAQLIREIGCLRTKGTYQRDFAQRIAEKIKRRSFKDIEALINDASHRAWDIWKAAYGDPEGGEANDDPRPVVDLATTDDEEVCRQVRDAIQSRCDAALENGDDPMLFEGPAGVSRVAEKNGQPVTEALAGPMWQEEINAVMRFRDGMEPKTKFLPLGLVNIIHASPKLVLPRLNGYDDTPVFGPDFELMTKPGYNKTTGRIYHPAPGLENLDVPEKPTEDQVREAVARLTGDVFEGFPFRDDETSEQVAEIVERVSRGELTPGAGRSLLGHSSRAHALAMVIEPFIRGALKGGRTPLYNLRKNNQRVGSGLLLNTIALIAFGKEGTFGNAPTKEEEMFKLILTWIEQQAKMNVLDNFVGTLESPSFAAAMTAPIFEGRKLSTNTLISGPLDGLKASTGNNYNLGPDFVDRSVLVRMISLHPRPSERTDFKRTEDEHKAYLSDARPQLVTDVLTLVQNYKAKGCVPFTGVAMGGFSEWVGHMGGILRDAGISGFMENRHLLRGGAIDPEAAQLRAFLTAWWVEFGETAVRVGNPEGTLSKLNGDEYAKAGLLALIKRDGLELKDVDVGARTVDSVRQVFRNKLQEWTEKPVVIGGGDSGLPEMTVTIIQVLDRHRGASDWALRKVK